jgi:DNA-binding CsgD family transcriptional regulator
VLREFPHDVSTFTRVARAWARWELGRDPGGAEGLETDAVFLAGAVPELEGLVALAAERDAVAAERFSLAAKLWQGRHGRGELRCLWAAGEALRRCGNLADGLPQLLEAERRAIEHEHVPYLSRVRRSLRLAGQRRAAPRGSGSHGLTAREQEVLALVADGLTNVEIARRLSLGRPTVERLVTSASTKLGARSRRQAAALAARP